MKHAASNWVKVCNFFFLALQRVAVGKLKTWIVVSGWSFVVVFGASLLWDSCMPPSQDQGWGGV